MFEKFTEKAIKVIMLAQEEARRLGHSYIGTEKLLLGLIGESSGRAAIVLSQLGVTLRAARQEVESLIGLGPGYFGVEIPFTKKAQTALKFALEASSQLGLDIIDTEHLLLGVLSVEQAAANWVLGNLGVDLPELRTRLLELARDRPAPEPQAISSEEPRTTEPRAISSEEPRTTTSRWIQTSTNIQFMDPWATSALLLQLVQRLDSLAAELSGTLAEAAAISQTIKDRWDFDDETSTEDVMQSGFDRTVLAQLIALPDSPRAEQPGLKDCLLELREAIVNSPELANVDQAEGLEQIQVLAEASQSPQSPLRQRIARTAVKILRGTIAAVPAESPLTEVGDRCLPMVLQHFGLN